MLKTFIFLFLLIFTQTTFQKDLTLIINPQGCVGEKALNYMNYPGTTTIGGQISYILNFASALCRLGKTSKVRIVSQRIEHDFSHNFSKEFEKNGCYSVDRFYVGKSKRYIDKEAVLNGKNIYYKEMADWGIAAAAFYSKNSLRFPSTVVFNYWDSYVAFTHMVETWKRQGENFLPRVVVIPHSLGYRKLISTLISKVKGKPSNLSETNIKDEVFISLKELLEDEHVLYPQRILAERMMLSNPDFLVNLNSKAEKEQVLSGPYKIDFNMIPKVSEKNIVVNPPGVDFLRFGEGDENSFAVSRRKSRKIV